MKIQIVKIKEEAKLPTTGSEGAAGADLYAMIEKAARIEPHKTAMIGTGVAVSIPDGYFGGIFARSGLAAKKSLRPANCVGVIDSDYTGEIFVALHNDSETPHIIEPFDRIAQLVVMPCMDVRFELVEKLGETDRADGGFGSTGV